MIASESTLKALRRKASAEESLGFNIERCVNRLLLLQLLR